MERRHRWARPRATPCAHMCVAERGSVRLARRERMVLNAFVGGLRQAARSARSNREETAEAADSVRWQTQVILMAHDAGTERVNWYRAPP